MLDAASFAGVCRVIDIEVAEDGSLDELQLISLAKDLVTPDIKDGVSRTNSRHLLGKLEPGDPDSLRNPDHQGADGNGQGHQDRILPGAFLAVVSNDG